MKLKQILFSALILGFFSQYAFSDTKMYTVKSGDSLNRIADEVYNDPSKWIILYEANKDLIKNSESIQVGWELILPDINEAELKVKQKEKRKSDPSVLRLVTGNNYIPFTDEKLPEDGMTTEIVVRAFEKIGKDVDLEFWSWKHGYEATKEGEFVATFPYIKDEKRIRDFYYSEPVFNIQLYGFVKKNSSISYSFPEDLRGYSVCKPEGYSIEYLQSFVDKQLITLKRPKQMTDCFKMLAEGEVDIVSTNEFEAKGIMAREFGSIDHFRKLEKPFSESPLHLIFPKNQPDNLYLLLEFNNTLKDMSSDGALQKIIKRHMLYYKELVQEG